MHDKSVQMIGQIIKYSIIPFTPNPQKIATADKSQITLSYFVKDSYLQDDQRRFADGGGCRRCKLRHCVSWFQMRAL